MALIDVNGKRFKNFMAKLYGIGAAVVILGALFKIMHWEGANYNWILRYKTAVSILH
jgi:hypothetical protein